MPPFLKGDEEVAVKMLLRLDPGRRKKSIETLKREYLETRRQAKHNGLHSIDVSIYCRLTAIEGKLRFFETSF